MRLEREAMASRHRPTRIPMSSYSQTRRNTHHEMCRRMVEPLTEQGASRERDRRYTVFIMTKTGTAERKSRGKNAQEVRR